MPKTVIRRSPIDRQRVMGISANGVRKTGTTAGVVCRRQSCIAVSRRKSTRPVVGAEMSAADGYAAPEFRQPKWLGVRDDFRTLAHPCGVSLEPPGRAIPQVTRRAGGW